MSGNMIRLWWRSLALATRSAVVVAGLLMVSNGVFAVLDIESRMRRPRTSFLFLPDHARLAHSVAAIGSAVLLLALARFHRLIHRQRPRKRR